jgi:hypothetical protein
MPMHHGALTRKYRALYAGCHHASEGAPIQWEDGNEVRQKRPLAVRDSRLGALNRFGRMKRNTFRTEEQIPESLRVLGIE